MPITVRNDPVRSLRRAKWVLAGLLVLLVVYGLQHSCVLGKPRDPWVGLWLASPRPYKVSLRMDRDGDFEMTRSLWFPKSPKKLVCRGRWHRTADGLRLVIVEQPETSAADLPYSLDLEVETVVSPEDERADKARAILRLAYRNPDGVEPRRMVLEKYTWVARSR